MPQTKINSTGILADVSHVYLQQTTTLQNVLHFLFLRRKPSSNHLSLVYGEDATRDATVEQGGGQAERHHLYLMRGRIVSLHRLVRVAHLFFYCVGLFPTWAAFSPLPDHIIIPSTNKSSSSGALRSSTSTRLEMMRLPAAKALITKAIAIGAPAYNEGNIDECAQIYQATALQVVQSNSLPKFLQVNLQQTLLMAAQQSSIDAAWAFRGQFDTILEYQEPITPFSPSSSRFKDLSLKQPFTNKVMFLNDPVVVNDNVMGGRSMCLWDETSNTFRGMTSLANNGGFASLRWRFKTTQNWNHAKGIYIRVQSQSKPMEHTFRLLLKDELCEQKVRGANYKVTFACPPRDPLQTTTTIIQPTMALKQIINANNDGADDNSSIIYIPFTAFGEMEQRGRKVMLSPTPTSPPGPIFLNIGAVTEIGIMAIKPTVVGDFELTIEDWGLFV